MLHNIFKVSVCSLSILVATSALAHNANKPTSHAPIGVMGEHKHKQGEVMLSYRYSHMNMEGNQDRGTNVDAADVLGNFMVAPLSMDMEMHMLGAMYGANDDLTLTLMAPYMRKSMHHINRAGVNFSTGTKGFGDTKIGGIYSLYDSGVDKDIHGIKHELLLNVGASLPTGSITQRDNTPAGVNQKLPYAMQLGSGTIDPQLGLTYTSNFDDWSWGGQVNANIRLGQNNEGYRLGNEYTATTWLAKNLNDVASVSFRLEGKTWGNINGNDKELNQAMVPTARPDLRGGKRMEALVGLNLLQPEGVLEGARVAVEYGAPIYQRLQGPQLELDQRLILGVQFTF